MKYMLLSVGALAVSLVLGILITGLLTRKRKVGRGKRVLLGLLVGLLLFTGIAGGYLAVYQKAEPEAVAAMAAATDVTVTKEDGYYVFDGPGQEAALLFFPGGKVETTAYAPLMKTIAGQGVDCFLLDMPFHLAVFGMNRPDKVLQKYDGYKTVLVGGHSLGGSAAALYANGGTDTVDGLVLLAAYPTKDVGSLQVLSVYGSLDGVLERDAYENAKPLWSGHGTEVVIAGGNHAGFGNYGRQSGDNEAEISAEAQQAETADTVVRFANGIK